MALLTRFFGRTVSEGAGYAAGGAITRTLRPYLQTVENDAWGRNAVRPPDVGTLAAGVAQGKVDAKQAQTWATQQGFAAGQFGALVDIASTGPGIPTAFDLWRRDLISEQGFRRAAKRQGIEPEWVDAMVQTKRRLIDFADLARGIHRGLIPDPGLLQGTAHPGPGKVPSYPVYPIDAVQEAAGLGYTKDDLGVLVGLQGNPASVTEAAHGEFRGLLDHNDVLRAGAEGNTRNEWVEFIAELARQIPTARDFIENWLRGYSTPEQALAGAALHGMTPEHAQLIFENAGRAMNLHQITQALAYGAHYNPTGRDDPDPYRQSTLVGSLRPEYYELNEALKYTLPSALYFRTLQQQQVLSESEAATWYRRLGWPPELADQVAKAYAKARSSAQKEATATDLLTLYDGEQATRPETLAALEGLGYPADEAARKLDVLDARRVASARTTAISDIHGDFKKGAIGESAALAGLRALDLDPGEPEKIVRRWNAYHVAQAAQPAPPPPPPA